MDPNQTIDPSTLNQYSGINMGSSPMLMPLPYNYPGYNTQGMTPGAMQQGAFADQMAFYNQSTSSAIMNQTSNMMMRDLQNVLQGSMMAAGQLQATAHAMAQRGAGLFAQPNDMVGQSRQFAIETSFLRDVANFALPKMGASRDGLLGRMLIGRKPDFLSQAEYEKAFELSAAERFGPQNKMRMAVAGVGSGLAMLPGVGWAGMLGLAVAEPIVERGISTFDAGMYGEQRFREFHKEYGFTRFGSAGENQSERQLRGLHSVIEHHDTVGIGGRFLRNIGMDSAADLFMKEKFRYEDINKMAVREGLYGQVSGERELEKQFRDLIPVLKEFSEKMRMAPEEVGKLLGYIKKATGYEATSTQSGVIMDQTAKIARTTGMKQEDLLQYAVQSAQQFKAMGMDGMTGMESVLKTTKQLYAYGQGGLADESLKSGQNAFAVANELAMGFSANRNNAVTMMAQMPGGSVAEKMQNLMSRAGGDINKFIRMKMEMRGLDPVKARVKEVELQRDLLKQSGLGNEEATFEAFERLGIQSEATRSAVIALMQNGGKRTFAETKTSFMGMDPEQQIQSIMKSEGLDRESATKKAEEYRDYLNAQEVFGGSKDTRVSDYSGILLTKSLVREKLGGQKRIDAAAASKEYGVENKIRQFQKDYKSKIQDIQKLIKSSDTTNVDVYGADEKSELTTNLQKMYGYKDDDPNLESARKRVLELKQSIETASKKSGSSASDIMESVSEVSDDQKKRIQALYKKVESGEISLSEFTEESEKIVGKNNTAILSSLDKAEHVKNVSNHLIGKNEAYEILGGDKGLEASQSLTKSAWGIAKFLKRFALKKESGLIQSGKFLDKVAELNNNERDNRKLALGIRSEFLKTIGMSEEQFSKLSAPEKEDILTEMRSVIRGKDQSGKFAHELDARLQDAKREDEDRSLSKDVSDYKKFVSVYGKSHPGRTEDLAKAYRSAQTALWGVTDKNTRALSKDDEKFQNDPEARKNFLEQRQSFAANQEGIKAVAEASGNLGKYNEVFKKERLEAIANGAKMTSEETSLLDKIRSDARSTSKEAVEKNLDKVIATADAEDKTMEKASLDAVKELTEIMRAINTKVGGTPPPRGGDAPKPNEGGRKATEAKK